MIPILEKKPDDVILHGGSNDVVNSTLKKMLDDLLGLKLFIKRNQRSMKSQFSFQ